MACQRHPKALSGYAPSKAPSEWPIRPLIWLPGDSSKKYFGAFKVKGETNFVEAGPLHRLSQALAIFGIKHQEAATAGANQLAAYCTIRPAQYVPLVNMGIAH